MSRRDALLALAAATVGFGGGAAAAGRLLRFAQPELLWLAALPILFTALYLAWQRWHLRVTQAIAHPTTARQMTRGLSWRRRHLQATLALIGLFLLVLAAARPQWGEEARRISREGIDIAVVFDLSRSMLAEDVAPSRLRAATDETERLLRRLHGDRVTLVPFAGVAWIQSPLTADHGAIRTFLRRLHPDDIPVQGTATDRALAEAERALVGTEEHPTPRAPAQVIVLVGDGEDHDGDPVSTARRLHEEHGIITYAVGIGTEDGDRIPIEEDGQRTWLRDSAGREVITRLEEGQLQAIAEAGGGHYFRYQGEGSVTPRVIDHIARHHGTAFEPLIRMEYADRFGVFLLPAMLLFLLAAFLGVMPRKPTARIIPALLALLTLAGGCSDMLSREDPAVREAIRLANADRLDDALERLDESDPALADDPVIAYNRGLILNRLERFEEARDTLLRALSTPDDALRADVLNALGVALLGLDNPEDAHERFRRALRIDPDHEDARRNLEIAHRRMFPPCEELDDFFAPNHTPAQAVHLPDAFYAEAPEDAPPLPEEADEQLVLCPGQPDYFAIPVLPGDRISASFRAQRLRDDTGGEPLPDTGPASQMRLELLDGDGRTILASSAREGAPASLENLRATLPEIAIPPHTPTEDGLVLLRLTADGPTEYAGELEVELTPGCRRLKGTPGSIGSSLTPQLLPEGEHALLHCRDDEDWYAVSTEDLEVLFLDFSGLTDLDGELPHTLQVSLYSRTGRQPFRTLRVTGPELVEVRIDPEQVRGQVRIRVLAEGDAEGQHRIGVYGFLPCPAGDRFAPNSTPHSRTPLGPDELPARHLRLCEGQDAWFELGPFETPDEDEDADADAPPNDEPIPLNIGTSSESEGLTAFLWTTSGQHLETEGHASTGDPTAPKPHHVLSRAERPPNASQIVLRLSGPPGFYHLDVPELIPPPPPPSPDEDQSDSEDSDDDSSPDGGEDQPPPDSDDDDGDDPADEDDEDGEDEEEGPPEDDPEDDPEDPQDSPEDGTDRDAEERELSEEERRLLLNLLDSLEEQGNLQLDRALRDVPPRSSQTPW